MCRDPGNHRRIARVLREEFPDLPEAEITRIANKIYAALFGIV